MSYVAANNVRANPAQRLQKVKEYMESVSKSGLVARIAQSAGVSHDNALGVVNALLEEIQAAVARGEKVTVIGFGTFEGRQRAARETRNPRTGEKIGVDATVAPAFKPAKPFKNRVADAAKRAS